MSTAMGAFLQSFDPATRALAALDSPNNVTTYKLYGGDVELLFDKEKHSYYVRLRGKDDLKKVVSSTGITGTLDKPALVPWAVMLAANEIIAKTETNTYMDHDVRRLHSMPFDEFREIVLDAKKEYRRVSQEALDIGHIAHDWLENIQKAAIKDKVSIEFLWTAGIFDLPVVNPDLNGVDEALQRLRTEVCKIQTAAVQNCCREAVEWMIVHNFRPLRVENKVYSIKYNCAGTFDTIGLFDSCATGACCSVPLLDGTTGQIIAKDFKVLADWKSSKALYNEYRFQLASYYEFWAEEHNERLDGRIVVKMPKVVGDEFKAYFLTNEDQPKDFAAFAGLLAPYQRIEEIEEVEWQQNQVRRAEVKAAKEANAAKLEAEQVVIRQLRDAERAKKKLDDIAAEVREAEEKAARRLEACPASGRYKGKKAPNCNGGLGCKACNDTYAAASGMRRDAQGLWGYDKEPEVK
jgi:hypothetical protein